MLPVQKTDFSTLKWVTVVYSFVALGCLVQGDLLIPNLTQVNGNLLFWELSCYQLGFKFLSEIPGKNFTVSMYLKPLLFYIYVKKKK